MLRAMRRLGGRPADALIPTSVRRGEVGISRRNWGGRRAAILFYLEFGVTITRSGTFFFPRRVSVRIPILGRTGRSVRSSRTRGVFRERQLLRRKVSPLRIGSCPLQKIIVRRRQLTRLMLVEKLPILVPTWVGVPVIRVAWIPTLNCRAPVDRWRRKVDRWRRKGCWVGRRRDRRRRYASSL